ISVPLADPYFLNTNGHDVAITNNLFTGPDTSGAATGVSPYLTFGHNGSQVSFAHNTVLIGYPSSYTGSTFGWDSAGSAYYPPTSSVTFKDNLMGWGNYGFFCSIGSGALSDCWPSLTETKNVFVTNVNPSST